MVPIEADRYIGYLVDGGASSCHSQLDLPVCATCGKIALVWFRSYQTADIQCLVMDTV